MRTHKKQYVTLKLYRAKRVTKLGPNISEPGEKQFVMMIVYRAKYITLLRPINLRPSEQGAYRPIAHQTICNDECLTMHVFRAEFVSGLETNNLEPIERSKLGALMRAHTIQFLTMNG